MILNLNELIETINSNKEDLREIKEMLKGLDLSKLNPSTTGDISVWQEETGLSSATFYTYRCQGRIPSRVYNRVGKKIVFIRSELRSWVQSGKPTPAQEIASNYNTHTK